VDPILGDRFSYFAKHEGEDGYKVHIAKHASEQEISSCSGFQAMCLANMKRVKGLHTMGIAGGNLHAPQHVATQRDGGFAGRAVGQALMHSLCR
jgi:hypothetical protein